MTITLVLGIGVMRKASSFQNILEAWYRTGIKFTIHWEILNHAREMHKRGYCSLCLTEKLWLLHILIVCTYLIRTLNSLADVDMRQSY